MDPIRTLTPAGPQAGPSRIGSAFAAAHGLAPAWGWRDAINIVAPVGVIGTGTILAPFEVERQRKRASEDRAKADREAAALEQRAREETARQLDAARRADRRRTGRASTILASAARGVPPLGVTTPVGPSAGGRPTLG